MTGKTLDARRRELLRRRLARARAKLAGGGSGAAAAGGEVSGSAVPSPAAPSPVAAASRGPFPLSSAQERLWFLERLYPGAGLFNIGRLVSLRGPVDRPALAAALDLVVGRHEALRTAIRPGGSGPEQTVEPAATVGARVGVAEVDLTSLPPAAAAAESRRVARCEARRPFDLGAPPLVRALLLRSTSRRAEWLLVFHHLVVDGWSIALILREVAAAGAAVGAGEPPALPPVSLQMAGCVERERARLAAGGCEEAVAYWRRRLAGLPAPLELPADRPRRGERRPTAGRRRLRFEPAALAEIDAACAAGSASRFMLLLAAWSAWLARLAGRDELVIGVPVAQRDGGGREGAVGLLVETLPLRLDLGGDPTVGQWLARVRGEVLATLEHSEVPLAHLLERALPANGAGPGAAAPFTTLFSLQSPPAPPRTLAGAEILAVEEVDRGVAEQDLVLALETRGGGARGGGLEALLLYSREVYDGTTAERWLRTFARIARQLADEPDRPLAALDWLAPAERHQCRVEWNDTAVRRRADGPLPEVTAWAAERPDAVAVVDSGAHLSYGELLSRALTAAGRLAELGVGSETTVALSLGRHAELAVGALAVLAAGGAYLPVDPAAPDDRVRHMLADSGAVLWLVRAGERDPERAAAPGGGVRRLAWDEVATPGASPGLPSSPVSSSVSSSGGSCPAGGARLAYVIYTSGSTGRPKGTLLTHAGLGNLAAWHRRVHRLGPGDRTTLLAGPGFDASVWELWSALAAGATLCAVPGEVAAWPDRLAACLAAEAITQTFLPTPLAEAYLAAAEDGGTGPLPALRAVHTGGDRLHRHPRPGRGGSLVNHYGPTEATVVATWGPVPAAPDRPSAPVRRQPAIGRPVDNARALLLDRRLAPVPLGAAGELCLGGAGLGRGYLGRPALTAERFVPDPGAGRGGVPSGARLYRSGDAARFLPGGEIDFLGRLDRQVQVRGLRVEPGEIEAALAMLPGVREAAVLAREGASGVSLAAFVVAEPELADEAAAAAAATAAATTAAAEPLRRGLAESLPPHMVPARFVFVAALPLTANGKVDRRALARLDTGGGETADAPYEPPRGPLEELVAATFATVLGAERVGRRADFFALGGHSLLAARAASRIERGLGVELPLRRLFTTPTVAALAAWLAGRRGDGEPPARRLPRAPRPPELPASPAQRRLWFVDRLSGGASYNVPAALRLEGAVSHAVLRAALGALAARHESLRTAFGERDGEPVQRLLPEVDPAVPEIDLTALPEARGRRELDRVLISEAARRFDLGGPRATATAGTGPPLWRFHHLRLAPARSVFAFTAHHIVADGGSVAVFLRELAELYAAGRQRRVPRLAPKRRDYADFAAWHRARLTGSRVAAGIDRWRRRLDGVEPLDLPADRPRPAVHEEAGRRLRVVLAPAAAAAVRRLVRDHGLTLFQTLFAVYSALLGRLTGRRDLTVGTPMAGRLVPESEGMIGFFVNPVVLRADLGGDPSFAELASRVREVTLAAYDDQGVPFDLLVEELAPDRDPAYPPLFQTLLVLQSGESRPPPWGPVAVHELPVDTGYSKFDLTLALRRKDGGLAGHWAYRTALFDATTVRRLARSFESVLVALAAAPRAPLSRLPLLTAAERQQLLVEWNEPPAGEPWAVGGGSPEPPFEMVAARAAAHPDRVALAWEGGVLTYRALATAARALGRRLVRLGAGADVPVGVLAERSPETVVALAAALAAGAAWVPLDPDLPAERRAQMLADSGAPIVLGQAAHRGAAPRRVRFVELAGVVRRAVLAAPSGGGTAADPERAEPEAAAYMIYTSGSTGRPKGVVVSHRALAHRLRYARAVDFTPADAFLHKTTICFDVSVLEVFGPLVSGGRVVLARPGGQADADYLVRWMAAERVTQASFPPTLLGVLCDGGALDRVTSLGTVITGGETVPASLPGRFHRRSRADLLNRYGPTEATVSVSSWRCRRGVADDPLPIGRPTAGARLLVLDERLMPLPAGATGELCIGGPVLARGYHRRPRRTAAAFVPDPLSRRPGARLYRSGDLARLRADGALLFAGRIDNQVKVRGFRIELGEVEAALRRHPAVAEAAVIDVGSGAGKQLAAYWTPAPGVEAADGDRLRDFLAGTLPDYMLPAGWVRLDRLPLTASGKVDRRSLPAPPIGPRTIAYRAPRDPLEERLAAIWEAVLDRDRIGVDDDFFALGGHSLLAMRLVSRVREELAVELPLRALFESPTVAGLAAVLPRADGGSSPGARSAAAAGPPVAAGDDLSPGQRRLWFLDRLQGGCAYNLPAGLALRGALRVDLLRRALAEIVARHGALRTRVEERAGRPRARLGTARARLPLIDLAALAPAGREREADRLRVAEARQRFDLARGPLYRFRLLRLGPRQHRLLVTTHHLVADAWSAGVLWSELEALYAAGCSGRRPALPPVAPQAPAVWAQRERRLAGGEGERQLAYWRRQLAGVGVLDLPLDRPRRGERRGRAGSLSFRLEPEVRTAFERLARRRRTTLFTVLAAAFQAVLGRLAGSDDVAVGTPVAGRGETGAGRLIGFFLNTLVLRTDLSGGPTFLELVSRVRSTVLAAFDHQELPFERLVDELEPERDLTRSPLFQAMLVVQDAAAPPRLPGLAVERLAPVPTDAKLDLTLALRRDGPALAGRLEYDRHLFDATTAVRMVGAFRRLAAAAAVNPRTRWTALPLLSAAQRHQIVCEWNEAPPPPALPAATHRLFLAAARRRSEAVAVVGDGEAASYGGLERRSRRLAGRLRAAGVGTGSRVAISLRRDRIAVAEAVLAVLRAGAVCVPIDPGFPLARQRFILEDAAVAALLTAGGDAGELAAAARELGVPVVGGSPAADRPPSLHPLAVAAGGPPPGRLAYVVYTSGSTGVPKGVAVPHATLASMIAWQTARLPEGAGRVLQFAPAGFDVFFQEMFSAWASGGTLVLVAERDRQDPERLLAALARQRIESLFLPFIALQQLAEAWGRRRRGTGREARSPAAELALARVMTAGEQLQATPPVRALFAATGALLENQYWPSETRVATCETMPPDPTGWPPLPPIGRPVSGASAHVLAAGRPGAGGEPLPIGVAGELYLGAGTGADTGTDGLHARGYLGRPARTATSFLPDPFGGHGARLYRSGDVARRRPDGRLEFLGRRDGQVKVRGYRVELGEVEVATAACTGVAGAAAMAVGEGAERRLIAYAVIDSERSSAATVRAELAAALPAYMVPARVIPLDRLPRIATGKVDRAALPSPSARRPAGREPPRGDLERRLAGLWCEVLGIDRVGRDESFFALGGHSLLAVTLVHRIEQELGVELALSRLFERPTVAGLAARIAAAAGDAAAGGPIETGGDRPPPSMAQQRLWFLDRLEPGGSAYNLPLALRLDGPLKVAALAAAAGEIARRHQPLRTVFPLAGGEPAPRVVPTAHVPFLAVDLGALPAGRRLAAAERLVATEAWRPFDLERGPVCRWLLVSAGERRHRLLISSHHVTSDGRSIEILLRELAALYRATLAGEPSPLPEPPIRYSDYAAWQRRHLAGERLERQIAYWRRRLAGVDPPALPLDRPRPARRSWAGDLVRIALPAATGRAVLQLARRCGVTPFTILFAACSAFLARLTGERRIVVGTPVAGRTRPEVEGLIGFFVNTLVLRCDLDAPLPFGDLVARAWRSLGAAQEHQELPFERLVEELAPERSRSQTPLFQVALALRHAVPPPALAGVTPEPIALRPAEVKNDLSFGFRLDADPAPGEGRLAAGIEYAAELFDRSTVIRWGRQLGRLLTAAADDPDTDLWRLPLLSAAERHQLECEWNDTATALPRGPLAPAARAAAATPDAVAVAARGAAVSYGELARRAGGLARRLRSAGVGPGRVVAVCAERSSGVVAALLACLEAGVAYLPLDPASPPERAAGMMTAAGAEALLVDAAGAAALGTAGPAVRLRIDAGGDLPRSGGEPSGDAATPDSLAYILFTSGSTGRPKGVAVRHRSLANHLAWMDRRRPLAAADRVLHLTPATFDAAAWELFAPLAAGGTVVLAAAGDEVDAAGLAATLVAERVTVLQAVPTQLRLLLAAGTDSRSLALSRIVCGGEALPRDLARRLERRLGAPVGNFYGPTEATVDAAAGDAAGGRMGFVPIGRPVDNARLVVLGSGGELQPLGAPGELWIGGEGLAIGYPHHPRETAERFRPDPSGGRTTAAGSRLYGSGDRARTLATGELEYLGRADDQVKVRGVRLEPAEVEAALESHPGVVESAVAVDRGGEPARLVAWVVATGERPPAAEVLATARRLLPRAAVPSAVVFTDALPRTASGKLDRGALARSAPAAHREAGEGAAARDLVELRLAGIWEELLGGGPFGAGDDFFSCGGHSLLGVRLMTRIEEELGARLPVSALFDHPTLEALAAAARDAAPPPTADHLVRLVADGHGEPTAWVHPVGGGVTVYQELAAALGRPFWAFQARGLDGRQPFDDLDEMARRYLGELRAARPAGPYSLGGWSLGGLVAFEMARRLVEAGEEVAELVLVDSFPPGAAAGDAGEPAGRYLLTFARGLGVTGAALADLADGAGRLPREVALERVVRAARAAGRLPPGIGEREVAASYRTFEAHLRAAGRHVVRPYEGGGRVVLAVAGDRPPGSSDPVAAWRALVGPRLEVLRCPGDHFSMLEGERARRFAARLRRLLAAPTDPPTAVAGVPLATAGS